MVRGVARTAVIAGTATATANAVNRRQASRQQAQYDEQMAEQAAYETQQAAIDSQQQIDMLQQQMAQMQAQQAQAAMVPQAPAASPAPGGDLIEQLQQLAQLKEAGVLSDAEFEAAKAQLLGG
ncbi:MAG TPA: SHOCT domain-containing protein [Thermomicrobiales bacterium]|nr:SHOCT domain-containing protein [Thermomicrobiales bacterium]